MDSHALQGTPIDDDGLPVRMVLDLSNGIKRNHQGVVKILQRYPDRPVQCPILLFFVYLSLSGELRCNCAESVCFGLVFKSSTLALA